VRWGADQRKELEHLCRYITRPAIANEAALGFGYLFFSASLLTNFILVLGEKDVPGVFPALHDSFEPHRVGGCDGKNRSRHSLHNLFRSVDRRPPMQPLSRG
jgi:hypothetical protein